jgi:hypothetical protein
MTPSALATNNLQEIRLQFGKATEELNNLELKAGESLRDFEHRVKKRTDEIMSLKIAEQVQQQQINQEASEVQEQVKEKLNQNPEEKSVFKIRGWREILVLFLGGYEIPIVARFFATNKTRFKKSKGFYPSLSFLGICENLSPATVNLLAYSATALGSLRDAQSALDAQGMYVSLTRISTAVRITALTARTLRKDDPSLKTVKLKGAKVVTSVDGGRIRIRRDKKGSKTKKNRTRYTTDWREPKLLCIYFLDENGEIDRSIAPILDGTMAHVDEIFKMLCNYLSMLQITSETEVLFISDGADCLWKRVHLVEKVVREKGGRFHYLMDYYHMKGYLHEMAGAAKDWTEKKRKQWIDKMTKLLFSGDNVSFETEVKALQKNSRLKSVLRTAGNYLLKHSRAGRMKYGQLKSRNLPIGSGVIESTVRRVVNLRLKGASVYWTESMVEDMLLLRCFYKAMRWQHIENKGFMPLKLNAEFATK